MIDYIQGKITDKNPTEVVIDINGLGYKIFISLFTYSKIQSLSEVKLFIYLQIKEDAHNLFGFYDLDERSIFLNLITISGVGSNTARLMLSSLSPNEIFKIITTANVSALERIKGIGKKTAERIVLELKDKLLKQKPPNTPNSNFTTQTDGQEGQTKNENSVEETYIYTIKNDTIAALTTLGINRTQAEATVNKIINSNQEIKDVENFIKLALQSLS